jgi:hypothetical protein
MASKKYDHTNLTAEEYRQLLYAHNKWSILCGLVLDDKRHQDACVDDILKLIPAERGA